MDNRQKLQRALQCLREVQTTTQHQFVETRVALAVQYIEEVLKGV